MVVQKEMPSTPVYRLSMSFTICSQLHHIQPPSIMFYDLLLKKSISLFLYALYGLQAPIILSAFRNSLQSCIVFYIALSSLTIFYRLLLSTTINNRLGASNTASYRKTKCKPILPKENAQRVIQEPWMPIDTHACPWTSCISLLQPSTTFFYQRLLSQCPPMRVQKN